MGQLVFQATAGGQVALVGPNPSSNFSINVPAVNSTLATLAAQTFAGTQTFTVDASISGLTVGKGANAISSNTAVGSNVLRVNSVSGAGNTGMGTSAFYANTDGSYNSAFGYTVLGANTTGNYNTGVGAQALNSNTTASNNTAVGYQAGYSNTTGTPNDAFGYQALYSNTTGTNNVALGYLTLNSNTTGLANTAIGSLAGQYITTGTGNTLLGANAGQYGGAGTGPTTGNYNTYIGSGTISSTVSVNGELVVAATGRSTPLSGKGTGTGFIYAATSGGTTNGIYQGNNSTLWSITSDQRIKENIETLTGNLDIISKLRPVSFNYKTGDKKKDISFIAQEYQQVLPDQVNEHDANAEEKEIAGTDTLLGLTPNLVPYLVGAIQELTAKVTALEAKLGA